jgi:Transposase IS116/IS110/IS902 family
VIARLRCFRGIDTLTAAGLCAEVGDFARFSKPTLLSGFLGVVPSELTSKTKRRQGSITKAGPGHARRLLVEAAHHYRHRPFIGQTLARRQAEADPRVIEIAWRAQRRLYARWGTCTMSGASPRVSSRSRAPVSSPRFSGRQPPLTDHHTPIIASGTLPGRARAPGRLSTVARRLATRLWAANHFGWQHPFLDG